MGVRGVDSDRDSDLGEGIGSENEEEGVRGVDISDGVADTHDSRKGKGCKRNPSNSVSVHVSTAAVPTSKSIRGTIGTPNVRMHDQ